MKRIVASVGLAAIGASTLHIASAQDLSSAAQTGAKPWNLSATLRGFYDDNINSAPGGELKDANGRHYFRSSTGFEVSPSATFTWDVQATKLDLSYAYSARYFDNPHLGSTDNWDQDHTFTAALTHAFNERWRMGVNDSFVVGQEPDQLQAIGGGISQVTYVHGDNYRNYGAVVLDGQLTPEFGTQIGYDNTFYHYNATGGFDATSGTAPEIGATLNRIEQSTHLEGRVLMMPETYGLLGFRFRDIDYNSDKAIGLNTVGDTVNSDVRNVRLFSPYVGLEHNFTPQTTASVRVGASYADYYNDSDSSGLDAWSPYVAASLKYTYAPESYVELGFTHDVNATDLSITPTSGHFTADEESSTVYGSLNHRILPKLYGSLLAQFQDSQLNGGSLNNQTEDYYTLGANLEYRFTPNFSTHVGYNYDNLQSVSEVSRTYTRNRVYIGVTASY